MSSGRHRPGAIVPADQDAVDEWTSDDPLPWPSGYQQDQIESAVALWQLGTHDVIERSAIALMAADDAPDLERRFGGRAAVQFDGQTVRCRTCDLRWTAAPDYPYVNATDRGDGVCVACFLMPVTLAIAGLPNVPVRRPPFAALPSGPCPECNGTGAVEVGKHTCGTGPDGYYGAHEPGCGLEPCPRGCPYVEPVPAVPACSTCRDTGQVVVPDGDGQGASDQACPNPACSTPYPVPVSPQSCPACGSETRSEPGLVPGGSGRPVTCGHDWHDDDAPF
jgi:hypothetical protein